MRSIGLTGLLLLFIAASDAGAQLPRGALEGGVDIGTALLRQPDLPGSSVLTLASQLRYAGQRASIAASGIAARTPEDRFTAQGIATASLYAPAARRFRWELAASATAFGLSGARATLGWQAVAREHVSVGAGGLFVGAGGASTSRDDRWRPSFVAHAGGFRRLDPLGIDELSGVLAFTRAELSPAPDDPFARRTILSYSDAAAYWSHDRGRLELLLGGGVRHGHGGMERTATWAAGSATLWVAPRLGITASAGRALADVVRGVPTVRYAALAMRIGLRSRLGMMAGRERQASSSDDGAAGPRVIVERGAGELRIITVRIPAASDVEIMADFTEWEPVKLARDTTNSDVWTLTLPVTSGTHRIAVRVDGGEWVVPVNLPRVADEFGGSSGIITVP